MPSKNKDVHSHKFHKGPHNTGVRDAAELCVMLEQNQELPQGSCGPVQNDHLHVHDHKMVFNGA